MIEKSGVVGGNSLCSQQGINAADSKVQETLYKTACPSHPEGHVIFRPESSESTWPIAVISE